MDIYTLAFCLIIGNLLHGGFLMAFSVRDLIRKKKAYDQKFNGLTYLVKGIALILISLFIYYLLENGFGARYIVCAMILVPLLPHSKEIWDSRGRVYRAIFESRAEILIQHNNERLEQLEDRKFEYISTLTAKAPEYCQTREFQ